MDQKELNNKAKILCSIHACSSMAEGRRVVQGGGFEKALRRKGVQPLPGVPLGFDVSNVLDKDLVDELKKLANEGE